MAIERDVRTKDFYKVVPFNFSSFRNPLQLQGESWLKKARARDTERTFFECLCTLNQIDLVRFSCNCVIFH